MFDGYLSIGGVEVLNRARTAAYVKAFLPKVEVICDDAQLRVALGHGSYTSPTSDNAPWYRSTSVPTSEFYGLFPGKMEGAENSTREVAVTELSGNGAVMTSPRFGSLEIRFVATAFAKNQDSMTAGMAWLRQILSNEGCADGTNGCTGREAKVFSTIPTTTSAATAFSRSFYKSEVTEGPLVTKKFPTKGFVMWQVEFTITAGVPWPFTALADAGSLDMDTGSNFQDPAGEDCSKIINAYDDFIADPYFTAISRPPRPPVILPPNIIDISSWRRKTLVLPSATQRWGRVAPVLSVVTESTAAQYLRIRFYRPNAGVSGCDFDGEFVISYIPANTVLTLNSITREATMRVNGGRSVPAGHLLFGSNGRPFLWPSLGCQQTYTMTADLMPGQAGVAVVLETAVRE